MSESSDSPARPENSKSPGVSGHSMALAHELRHALGRLLETGEDTTLDLRRLPLGPGDEGRLLDFLGRGEIEARLDALGKSLIRETRFPGIWLIEHFNTEEKTIGRFIEVTIIPEILKSQTEDIKQGLARMTAQLAETEK